jgi:hypothetical protein
MTLWLLPVVVTACAGSSKPMSAGPMPQGGLACAKVGEDLIAAMPAASKAPQELKDKMIGAVSQSCEQDAWTADAKTCLDTARTSDALTECNPKFTPAQLDGMNKRMYAAMGAKPPALQQDSESLESGDPPPPAAPAATMPAPSPPPPATTHSSSKKKAPGGPAGNSGGDPCDGSE